MYQIIIGLAFLGMIVAPSLVAARTGKTEAEASEVPEPVGNVKKVQPIRSAPVEQVVMPASKQMSAQRYAIQ